MNLSQMNSELQSAYDILSKRYITEAKFQIGSDADALYLERLRDYHVLDLIDKSMDPSRGLL